jgi:hypothetical protein
MALMLPEEVTDETGADAPALHSSQGSWSSLPHSFPYQASTPDPHVAPLHGEGHALVKAGHHLLAHRRF